MTRYETDVIAWANEQAAFLRSGRFELIDIEHLAEEIEDVGKSEKRELASRWTVLLSHLIKWQYQQLRRGSSWEKTIKLQRKTVQLRIKETPSLKVSLKDPDWLEEVWNDALIQAAKETGFEISIFPDNCPWNAEQILSNEFFPD
jgi:hypothetical protein